VSDINKKSYIPAIFAYRSSNGIPSGLIGHVSGIASAFFASLSSFLSIRTDTGADMPSLFVSNLLYFVPVVVLQQLRHPAALPRP